MDFNSTSYKQSRKAYIVECTIEYLVSLLLTDAFLAKLLIRIGIDDARIGIISSLISLVFISQIFTMFLFRRITNVKKTVIIGQTISMLSFSVLYLIPFMPISTNQKAIGVVAGILVAYIFLYTVAPMYFNWANSFVEPGKRGRYAATKEMISLVCGMVFTMVTGYVIDYYEGLGNLDGAFLFLAISIFVLNLFNFISLLCISKNNAVCETEDKKDLRSIVQNTLKVKSFQNIVILHILYDSARYFTIGFLGVFKTKDLALSVVFIQIINILANISRLIFSKPFGKYSDRTSFVNGMKLALVLLAASFLFSAFTTRATWYLVVLHTILFHTALAGINQNNFNICYSYINKDYITEAMALKNCIGGLCGFLASLAGGWLLSCVQSNGNQIFGIPVYGQQLLSFISAALCGCAIWLIHCKFDQKKQL